MTEPALTLENDAHAGRLIGEWLGPTSWVRMTQDRVNHFAEATDDRQWIHVDPERAERGPFGAPIAHGLLTLSLVSVFVPQIVNFDKFSAIVNYGFDRVRFPAPVRVGQDIRGAVRFDAVSGFEGGFALTSTVNIELAVWGKLACSAQIISRLSY